MDYKAALPLLPESTYQILGAEKALFNALKSKGLINEQQYPHNQNGHQSKIQKVLAKKLHNSTQLMQQEAALGQIENLTLNETSPDQPQQNSLFQTSQAPNNDMINQCQDE